MLLNSVHAGRNRKHFYGYGVKRIISNEINFLSEGGSTSNIGRSIVCVAVFIFNGFLFFGKFDKGTRYHHPRKDMGLELSYLPTP